MAAGHRIKILFRLVLLVLFFSPFIIAILMIERAPLVSENSGPRFDDINHAKDIIKRFDPRAMPQGQPTEVTVTDAEVSIALGAALSRINWAHARIDVADDGVLIQGTAKLPIGDTFLGRYLNVTAIVAPSKTGVELSKLQIGAISFPTIIVKPVAVCVLDWFMGGDKGEKTYDSVRAVAIKDRVISVTLLPPADLFADVKTAVRRFAKLNNVEGVEIYYTNLIETSRTTADRSLTAYLRNAFALARERSVSGDPVEENRTLILALALCFGDSRFAILLQDVHTPETNADYIQREHVTVQERHDWVQHFTTSAGLAVVANSGISDLVGLAKEIKDAQGSEGFSFGDLAADRTGVRLADVATTSIASARRLQEQMTKLVAESDFFPKADDLPDSGLTEAKFKTVYGDVNTPAYEAQLHTIDTRIMAIDLYK